MANEIIGKCPVCGEEMKVTRLHCYRCDTTIEGRFDTCKFCLLDKEQKQFVEIFLKSRGNIKEVERELGISYPTVRSRLDAVLESLGYRVERRRADNEEKMARRRSILESLEKGELTPEEAAKMLRER